MSTINQSLNIIGLVLFFTFITSCSTTTNEDQKIRSIINDIYQTPYPYRNEALKSELFSENLITLMSDAKQIEQESIEGIPMSERTNIKPYILEGEIFASLYDGYVSYSITKISFEENTSQVELKFINDIFTPKEIWTDQIIVVNENGWKLDNVIYNEDIRDSKDLKSALSSFIEEYNKENFKQN